MRITKRLKEESSEQDLTTKTWEVIFEKESHVFNLEHGQKLIVEGDIYYVKDEEGNYTITEDLQNCDTILKSIYSNGLFNISNVIEGRYVAALVDDENDTVIVSGDNFANIDLFYNENDGTVSTEILDVLSSHEDIQYQQETLYCILSLRYSPAKHTPYNGMKRLAYDEQIVFNNEMEISQVIKRPMNAISMEDKHLEEYADILKRSILSRASDLENWVLVSGGWDSSIILATLCKNVDKRTIKPIVSRLHLPDGKVYNPYEVEKAVKTANYYGLKCEVVDTHFSQDNVLEDIKDLEANLKRNQIYDWLPSFYNISNFIKQNGSPGASVFYGAFSDALHNFGFTQYFTLPYLSYDFREYGDKMNSYLYSPSFLKKVLNSTYEDDFVFKLFWWHANSSNHPIDNKDEKDALLNYLISFIHSDLRIPFAKITQHEVFTESGKEKYRQWLLENYFQEAVDKITPDNMYFYLTHLYKYFHLQGSENRVIQSSIKNAGFKPCLPFLDMELCSFLSQMPENWGRGLEWKHIKYPLKEYAKNHLDLPVDIIMSDYHSYIDEKEEDDQTMDWRSEIVNKSLGLNWKNKTSQEVVDKIFDESMFNIGSIKENLSNQCDPSNSRLCLNMTTLLTIGLEGMEK